MDANNSPTKIIKPFTEDNLELIRSNNQRHRLNDTWISIEPDLFDSILDRLEASERCIQPLLTICQDGREDEEYSEKIRHDSEETCNAWRVTKGEEPIDYTE